MHLHCQTFRWPAGKFMHHLRISSNDVKVLMRVLSIAFVQESNILCDGLVIWDLDHQNSRIFRDCNDANEIQHELSEECPNNEHLGCSGPGVLNLCVCWAQSSVGDRPPWTLDRASQIRQGHNDAKVNWIAHKEGQVLRYKSSHLAKHEDFAARQRFVLAQS